MLHEGRFKAKFQWYEMMDILPLSQEMIYTAVPIILLAGMIHGAFGVGFPLIATPLLALFTDVLTAVLITLLPTLAVNASIIYREGIRQLYGIRQYLLIIPFVLVGTLAGSQFLLWFDARPFLLILAIAIILYLNQKHLEKLDFSWVRKNRKTAFILFGLTAGLMGGTVNVMLPVLVILFIELSIASSVMAVLFNINFFVGKLTQSLFFLQGISGFNLFLFSTLWLIPAALLSFYAGSQVRKYISETRYLWVLRGMLWLMSFVLIIRFLSSYALI